VATGIENAYPAAYNRMDADAIAFYAPLFRYTAVGQYTQFLEAVSGSSYANTLQAALVGAQLLNTAVDQRLSGAGGALGVTNLDRDRAPTAAGARALWATVLGSWAKGHGDTNAPGFNQDTSGFAFGADYRLNPQTLVGLLAGYQHGRIDFDNHGNTDTTSWQLGAYGQYDTGRWYGNGLLTFGWNGYESQRQILLSNAASLTKGSYNGTALVLYGEGGYKLPLGAATIKPMLGLGYVSGDTSSFTERGSVYRLHVQGASFDSFTSNLGVRAELAYRTPGGTRITGEARAIWQHEFLKDQQSVNASFAVLPGSDFRVLGSRFATDSAILGLGVKAQLAAHTELSLNYDTRLNSDYSANSLFAAVRMDW
jgi:outer membrane autotransporter protein